MGKSLADQLLSAGLVDAKKIKQLQQEKRKEQKQQPKKGQNAAQAEQKQKLEQARAQKAEQDRLLNEQRLQAERSKEIKAQVKQILQLHTVPAAGELRFNFKDVSTGKIRYLFVTETQQNLLAAGQLLICANGKRAVLISRETADKIKERLPEAILFDAKATHSSDPDDDYKDFPIPDDLVW